MNAGRYGYRPITILCLIGCLAWPSASVDGQTSEPDAARDPADGLVGSFGLGTGSKGAAGQISIWAQLAGHSLGFRTSASFSFELFGPEDSNEDYALLYGRRSGASRTWGRIGLGPAVVKTVRRGDPVDCAFFFCTYERHRESTVGLALQADGVIALFGPVAIGGTAFANLNPISTFGGLTLNLVLGRVGS